MYSATQTARTTKGVALESHSSDEELASLAKALAHPARLQIIRLLLEKKTCIGCDIVDEIGLAQSTVSEHLRILKSSGIITGEITRPRVCYSLNPERLQPLMGFLNLAAEGETRGSDASNCWVSSTTKTHES
jgi:ArsR family transcriptional regulator